MEQTLKNLELIVNEIKKNYNRGDSEAIKTLLNSYKSYLNIIRRSNKNEYENLNVKNELIKQFKVLLGIKNEIEKNEIQYLIQKEKYKIVHTYSFVVAEIESIISSICEIKKEDLLNENNKNQNDFTLVNQLLGY